MAARPKPLRAALAQIDSTVGDVEGNAAKIAERIEQASQAGAAIVVFPELALTGYPPEDLLLKTHFLDAAGAALEGLAADVHGIVALVGFPERQDDVYNSAAVLADGRVAAVYRKNHLPNYGVFDEQRYFQSGTEPALIEVAGVSLGITVCEDIWEPGPPASSETLAGAQVIVNLSASPYHVGKGLEREHMLVQRAKDNLATVLFCNAVGGQDELVFDGHSVAIDQDGRILARAPQFEESLTFCTFDPGAVAAARLRDTRHRNAARRERKAVPVLASIELELSDPGEVGGDLREPITGEAEVYRALVTGLSGYVEKNGFERVVLGLSGGIDSALCALLAADAVGPERVTCVSMPSPYSSEGTRADARAIAENLGVDFMELSIEDAMQAYEHVLAEPFEGTEPGVAEENVQARIRGNVVMALSNKFGWLPLATGNKSELSVGYATLYGDMAGGFAVLKDVFKTWVYRLARWRNAEAAGSAGCAPTASEHEERELVPQSVLDRPPSAELAHDQLDEDSLPPYDLLDSILAGYVELDLDAAELVSQGLPEQEVERVIRMVDRAEYKRRQAPPGIRISTKAFGRDRRLPITNYYESRARSPEASRPGGRG
jgi:NAD+ synthase (glutamine-hydrolysing)